MLPLPGIEPGTTRGSGSPGGLPNHSAMEWNLGQPGALVPQAGSPTIQLWNGTWDNHGLWFPRRLPNHSAMEWNLGQPGALVPQAGSPTIQLCCPYKDTTVVNVCGLKQINIFTFLHILLD